MNQQNLFNLQPLLTKEEDKKIKEMSLNYPELAYELLRQKKYPKGVAIYQVLINAIDFEKSMEKYPDGLTVYYLENFSFFGFTINLFDDYDDFRFFMENKKKDKYYHTMLYQWNEAWSDNILKTVRKNLQKFLIKHQDLILPE